MPFLANTVTPSKPKTSLNAAPWLAQALVFIGFVTFVGMELAAIWPPASQLSAAVAHDLGIIDIAGGVGIFLPIDVVFLALPAFVLWGRRVQPVRAR